MSYDLKRSVSSCFSTSSLFSILAIPSVHLANLFSASGDETKSGEVSDPGCSQPAAAMLDVRARMFTAQTLSRAVSLTLRCSVLCHTADERRNDSTLGKWQ